MRSFLFIILYFMTTFPLQAQDLQEPISAELFLNNLAARGGGAGNGGNRIVSNFFQEALVGLEIANFTQVLNGQQLEKVKSVLSDVKVYAVEFQLCYFDNDNTCLQGLQAKNYPNKNIILVDSRNLPRRWVQISSLERKRLAFHELLGLADIEVENHLLSTQINDINIFNNYKKKKNLEAYFRMLNNLFYMLPTEENGLNFTGSWGKKTVVRPGSRSYKDDVKSLAIGQKFILIIKPYFDDKTDLAVTEYDQKIIYNSLGDSSYKIQRGFCTTGNIKNGFFNCLAPKGLVTLLNPKWKGKFKKLFAPSFPVNRDGEVLSNFSCKPIHEDRLICRHYYKRQGILADIKTYEYAFYDRISI